MTGNVEDIIQKVESKWWKELIAHLEIHFEKYFLPSHDLSHHIRVWEIAKKILRSVSEVNPHISKNYCEATLLACMFHDTGLILTSSPEHGAIGKDYYQKFIKSSATPIPAKHKEIATAIDLHDRKTLDTHETIAYDSEPDLNTIVSIADDMDALGTIGIYRYTEIYLHRGIELKKLGVKIMQNVSLRYNFFAKSFSLFPEIINYAKPLYKEVICFFDKYNQQILSEEAPEHTFSGHIGVVNYIKNFSVDGTIRPDEFTNSLQNFTVGKFVNTYFSKLHELYTKK